MDRVHAAAAAAWPAATALGRFRRRVALELAATEDGPAGANSMLAARLTSNLRASYPALVKEACTLCHPNSGRLQLKQLIHNPGADNADRGECIFAGDNFMYIVPNPYDVCIYLDLPGLLKWHAEGGVAGPATPPSDSVRQPGYPVRRPGGSIAGGAARQPGGGAKLFSGLDLTGLVPRYGTPGADLQSPYCRTGDGGNDEIDAGAVATFVGGGNGFYWPVTDAAHMAFPGTAAASGLRRQLAACLAAAKGDAGGDGETAGVDGALPPCTIPYREIAPIVAASEAAAQQPALRTPAALRAFLLHPASHGAFATTRVLRRPADPASAVDCVSLSRSALRRAAGAGVAAAIAAAWPGTDPLARLKRAAARALAGAPASNAGPYTLHAGFLGNVLKERQPLAYAQVGGSLMAKLGEGDGGGGGGGYLIFVRAPHTSGCLRLRLHELCRDFPVGDGGKDLGMSSAQLAAGPAPSAASGAVPARSPAAQAQAQPPAAAAAPGASTGFDATNGWSNSHAHGSMAGYAGDGGGSPRSSDSGYVQYGNAPTEPSPAPQNDPWAKVRAGLTGFSTPTAPAAAATAVPAAEVPGMALQAQPSPHAHPSPAVASAAYDPSQAATPPQAAHMPEDQQAGYQQQPLVLLLPDPLMQWVRTPHEFDSMLRHCYAAAQFGLAVHASGADRRPERRRLAVAAFYAPAAAVLVDAGDGDGMPYMQQTLELPATVYLLDCAALDGGGSAGPGSLPGSAAALRALLESPHVAKVAHGCEQVASLAAACCAATIAQLHDTRVLLRAVVAMLPSPLPPLPAAPPAFAPAAGPLAAVAAASLNAHVSALRDALAGTGLWSDRPELMAALTGRHAAALREELFGSRDWASNPTAHEAALLAAARHLPELCAALVGEAVPWVALAAAAAASTTALEATRLGASAPTVVAPLVSTVAPLG